MHLRVLMIPVGLLLLGAASQAHAQWAWGFTANAARDDNVGNAPAGIDKLSDSLFTLEGTATESSYDDAGGVLTWGGRLAGESHARYSGLNNVALGGTLAYRKKLALGAYAPWWRIAWSSSALRYQYDVRDGWQHQAEFGFGKRVSERLSLDLALRYEKRTARDEGALAPGFSGDAYSAVGRTLCLNAEYAAAADVSLNLGASVRHGDVISTTHQYFQVFQASSAIADDDALGPDRFAYKLPGTTRGLSLGANWALSHTAHIGLAFQRTMTVGQGGNNYARNIASLFWVGDF